MSNTVSQRPHRYWVVLAVSVMDGGACTTLPVLGGSIVRSFNLRGATVSIPNRA